ncbi:DNA (cytosine-5-)-methyltransferase [Microcella alkalica]|uniref:DNA (cytosine-5-)-methyltransferase n=1 Tax=Microcella alkalica TaxID=355930 RepID=A0A839EB64_9MICO|nr:DNA cytosine methyltransferase [Microcella alkalica]MBA8848403.1 DNA (cytosine-5)-methyltransferase 1 [Microcella alkalica]
MGSQIPIIDLFSGAGGLGLGAKQAGGSLVLSMDNDRFAHSTMVANPSLHGGIATLADVTAVRGSDLRAMAGIGRGDDLIVVGGAPCQPFSKAAYWLDEGKDAAYRRARARGEVAARPDEPTEARPDERRTLVSEYWRLVSESNASGFIFENVPSILHPRNRPVFDALYAQAQASGYHLTRVVAKATEFGVAQSRQRVFLLGSRYAQPVPPSPTHSNTDPTLPSFVTAGQAIGHLDTIDRHEPEEVVKGTWAEHLAEIPPGMNYKHHTAWAGHPHPTFVTETRYWNFLLKLSPDKPSWTIPASPGPWTGPFHWTGRRLRTVELAVLQGFPEDYVFSGSRRERVRQIGNAVPAPMARAMAQSVLRTFTTSALAA